MLKLKWMLLKQKVTKLLNKYRNLSTANKTIGIITIFSSSILIFCTITLLQTQSVQFSYDNSSCTDYLTLLPDLISTDSKDFSITNQNVIKFGDIRLLSTKTCFIPKKAPTPGTTALSVSFLSNGFIKKNFKINIPSLPIIQTDTLSEPISATLPLELSISRSDSIHSYQIEADNKIVACQSKELKIYCNIKDLKLSQGKKYTINLVRMFNSQKTSTLFSQNITTISATTVIDSSIKQNQVVHDKPKTFTFNFDKSITKYNIKLEKIDNSNRTEISLSTSVIDKQITANVQKELDRNYNYEFTIYNIESIDGSTLSNPYTLGFKTSDGPSVISVNAGNFDLPLSKTIIITFDQTISNNQDISELVSVSGIPFTISKSNNQISINYTNVPICTSINIKISGGIQSNYGIINNNPWSFTTRTTCHTVQTIGYSIQNRPIQAYTFGNGSQVILYVGNIHGNELSTKYLMEAWIDELEQNIQNIPINKKVIVVPTINPDGAIANRRNNSNNIDLNRNFDTSDWQTDSYSTTNQLIIGGGGPSPMSEPETKALSSFTISLMPRLTMSFHSSASYTIANQAGDSIYLADVYSNLTGYRNATNLANGFSYTISGGTYDDWLREKYNLTSVVIEISSSVNSEFSRNKSALWKMTQL